MPALRYAVNREACVAVLQGFFIVSELPCLRDFTDVPVRTSYEVLLDFCAIVNIIVTITVHVSKVAEHGIVSVRLSVHKL